MMQLVMLCVLLFFSHAVSPHQGLQGDEVLVAGINTGTARVQVRLVDEEWKVLYVYL